MVAMFRINFPHKSSYVRLDNNTVRLVTEGRMKDEFIGATWGNSSSMVLSELFKRPQDFLIA